MSPWLTLRQAKDAIRSGRPDEAHRLLHPLVHDGYRKASRLLPDVATSYVARSEKHLRADNDEAAWKDLLAAEALNTGVPAVTTLRTTLTRLGVAECAAALEAGKPLHVVQVVEKLRQRQTNRPDLDVMEEIAQDWVLASEMADRGDFLLASSTLEKLLPRMVMCPQTGLKAFLQQVHERHERFRQAVSQLEDAAEQHRWAEAAQWAGEVIAAAPNHREARTIQLRAWESLRPTTQVPPVGLAPTPEGMVSLTAATLSHPLAGSAVAMAQAAFAYAATLPHPNGKLSTAPTSSAGTPSTGHVPMLAGTGLPKRFLLWIDGVGGYLVCLGQRITLGQATADGPIDVPVYADVSRMHAEMSRDGEGYLIESSRGIQVNGVSSERSVLKCGDRVTLGASCQFLFRKPVAISPTARLELVSGHRLPSAVDGVLLMAENLILGPGPQAHIVLPDAPTNIVIYRGKDGLGLKYNGPFLLDNSPCRERANLVLPSVVIADQFSFTLEPIGVRM